jgi:hypothetical protein
MMSTRAFRTCLPVLLVVCVASNAAAQQSRAPRSTQPAPAGFLNTPSFELSGGYQMLHIPDQTFPFGLNVDAAKHFGQLGLVAEVGFAFDSEDISGVEDVDATAWNFGAGGRWTGFNGGRVWPFAQMLVGAEVMRLSTEIADVDVSDTETSFMLQPGVGVSFVLTDGFGLIGQVDYRRTFFDEPDDVEDSINNQFRVFVGARMILD